MAWPKTSRHSRGYGTAWDKLRKEILARDRYLCQSCLANGKPRQANHVDHKTPKAKGGTDHPDNLQALCQECHGAKTIAENGGKPKLAIGADGWPMADCM